MRAGQLNKLISIWDPISTARSTDGGPILTYSTYQKDIWARVDVRSGKEEFRGRNRWDIEEVDFFVRWNIYTITPDMVVSYAGAQYDIKAVINVEEKNREVQLITKKRS